MKTIPPNLRATLALLLLAAASPALRAETDTATGLTYTIADGQAKVTGITDESLPTDGKLTIPETLGGAPVTAIGDSAFSQQAIIKELSASSVKQIGSNAFNNLDTLTTVSLPKATSIGIQAFYACTSLTDVSLPKATSIGFSAFSSCDDLTTVSLPGATSIEGWAFSYCNALTGIYLGRNPTLGNNAFVNTHTDLTIHHHPEYRNHFASGNWATYSIMQVSRSLKKNEVVRPYLEPVRLLDNPDTIEVIIYRKLKGDREDPEDWTYTVEQSTDLQVWTTVTPTMNARSISGDNRVDFRHFSRDTSATAAFYRVHATPNFFSTD